MSAPKPALASIAAGIAGASLPSENGHKLPAVKPKRKWTLAGPGGDLLATLNEQASLIVRGAEILRRGPNPEQAAGEFASLAGQARDRKDGLLARLRRNLLTPLDGEDLRTIASQCHRIVRTQAQCQFESDSVELAELSWTCATKLDLATHALPGKGAVTYALESNRAAKAATRLLRDQAAGTISATAALRDVLEVVEQRKARIRLFRDYLALGRTLIRVRLKNG